MAAIKYPRITPLKHQIIAVDFDGTLNLAPFPQVGAARGDLFRRLVKLQEEEGAIVILWTCRVGENLKKAVEFCKVNGLTPDYVNENVPELVEKFNNDCRKIYADIYIDDKSCSPNKFLGWIYPNSQTFKVEVFGEPWTKEDWTKK